MNSLAEGLHDSCYSQSSSTRYAFYVASCLLARRQHIITPKRFVSSIFFRLVLPSSLCINLVVQFSGFLTCISSDGTRDTPAAAREGPEFCTVADCRIDRECQYEFLKQFIVQV
jgi:hypothetical protein